PIITVGLGGTAVELQHDVASALAPVDHAEAIGLLRELRGFPMLDGYRGRPPMDVDAAARAIVGLSHVAVALGDRLDELEVNPLIVHAAGHGVSAVDLLVVVRAATP
ncbi:MAG: acetate--CoA ligase family protein, partial [Ilumatobacteraceae bacterium]